MIEQVFSHNIVLQDLSLEPSSTETINSNRKIVPTDLDYTAGYLYPMLQIRTYSIHKDSILNFEIDCYNKIPKVNALIRLDKTHPLVINVLRDRELLKVFLRTANNELNHIRVDFYITNVNRIDKSLYTDLIIEGELNIPMLYASINKAYSGTSYNVIKAISNELGLGFSSNISNTDDEMIWPAVNQSYYDFIDYVCAHSWIDDTSFMDWYIDIYYNIVFYDVELSLKYEKFQTKAYTVYSGQAKHVEEQQLFIEWENVITDNSTMQSTDHGYSNINIINNSKLSKKGYVLNNTFLDYNDLSVVTFDTESITNTNEGIPLKSRIDDDNFRNEKQVLYLGIQNDNMHPNYLYSPIHNKFNNTELKKLNLEVSTNELNLNYIVGDNIYLHATDIRLEQDANKSLNEKLDGGIIDQTQFTNNYKIQGIKYIYKKGIKYTKYLLTRREWPITEI